MRRELYPDDWEEISKRIRAASGGRCECEGECGIHRDHRCFEMNGSKAVWAKGDVMLTVAHLCHHPECRDLDHLKAMCQRCYLRYDNMVKQRKLKSKREYNQLKFF